MVSDTMNKGKHKTMDWVSTNAIYVTKIYVEYRLPTWFQIMGAVKGGLKFSILG